MPNVITITGPSAAGKSTLARFLLGYRDEAFKPRLVPKYTTRPQRLDDSGEVLCVESIPSQCDLVYEHYEHLYGLELETIEDALDDGSSPIVILNDIQTVKDVHKAFGRAVKSVFVFREAPSLEKYRDLAKSVGVKDGKEPVRRFLQAQAFYHIYSENIYLFDCVIVNGGTFADLDVQVRQVVGRLKSDPSQPFRPRRFGTLEKRLFAFVSTAGPTRDGLIRTVDRLGAHQAQIITEDTVFGKSENAGCDRAFAVLEGLQEGISPVLVIDSLERIGKLYEMFKECIVLVYVHSEADAEAYRRGGMMHRVNIEYVQRRLAQYRSAFDAYLHSFLIFDHVLIDAGNPFHLLDQLFWLFRAYDRGDLPRAVLTLHEEGSDGVVARPAGNVGGANARQEPPNQQGFAAGTSPVAC